jgi:DNA recombination protein RmuC
VVVTALIVGLAVGALAAWLVARARSAGEIARVQVELEHERAAADEKVALLEGARDELANAFKALSADALHTNNAAFLELAKTQLEQIQLRAAGDLEQRRLAIDQLVAPIRQSLDKVDTQVRTVEQARQHAFGALRQELASLREEQERLRNATGSLVTALRTPHVRGRWGEVQLRRVVEAAGMLERCDFVVQASVRDDEGALLRPDVIVKLPGGKQVVVDAKVPLAAYLDAHEAADEATRAALLAEHARQTREHVQRLAAKAYWRQFAPSPDFVIMFLPDETLLRAAQEYDSPLVEDAWRLGVVPASPSNLLLLLRTVAATWQQQTVADSAREIHSLGRELYERLGTLARHFAKLGRSLDGAVGAYNEAVGSLESRVLVSARKFESHGIAPADVSELVPIERQARPLQAVELVDPDGGPAELPPRGQANAA